jgi:SAM-dependent methyltransferase
MNKIDKLLKNTADIALRRRAKSIITNLDLKKGDRILDVGCGDGYYLFLLSNLKIDKLQLVGVDPDVKALESAKKNLSKIKLFKGDLMDRIPFKENTFDKVVMSEVAEHLPNDVKGLKEIYRVLKPGGVLCISVHIRAGFWAGIWNQHIRLYSEKDLLQSLKKAGFKVTESEVQTYWCLPFNHYLINFGARILAKNPHSNISKGASKFSQTTRRNWVIKLYSNISKNIDSLNELIPNKKTGVSLIAKAIKYDN